jgi:high-affinity iron transporter
MLAALLIVFREVIEAGLIVGIVLAAARSVPGRGRAVSLGVLAGLFGAALVAAFAGRLSALFEGSGQEMFEASVLSAAVVMLAWHNIWMASHGRELAAEARALSKQVVDGRKPLTALGVVVAIAVLREGSEVVLFLFGIAATGGASMPGMALGGALGVAAGAAVAALMYAGLLAIPAGRLLAVTGWLITLLAAGMASQAVAFLQQAGYFDVLAEPLWNTGWLLADGSIPGRLAHTLIGYTESPNGLQFAVYAAVVVAITGLARLLARPGRSGLPAVPQRPAVPVAAE